MYGKRVWQLLHSTAAYYPHEPTEADKQHARNFFTLFFEDVIEYPDWSRHIDLQSLDVDSNKSLRNWVCV